MTAEPIRIYTQPWKTVLLTVLAVCMTALSTLPLWLLWTGQSHWGKLWFILPVGCVGVVFFGMAAIKGARRVFDPKPILSIDKEGIHVWRYPTICWAEFDGADAAVSSGEGFVVLHTIDPEAYRNRMGPLRRRWEAMNSAMVPGSVYLSGRLLPLPVEEVADWINRSFLRPDPD